LRRHRLVRAKRRAAAARVSPLALPTLDGVPTEIRLDLAGITYADVVAAMYKAGAMNARPLTRSLTTQWMYRVQNGVIVPAKSDTPASFLKFVLSAFAVGIDCPNIHAEFQLETYNDTLCACLVVNDEMFTDINLFPLALALDTLHPKALFAFLMHCHTPFVTCWGPTDAAEHIENTHVSKEAMLEEIRDEIAEQRGITLAKVSVTDVTALYQERHGDGMSIDVMRDAGMPENVINPLLFDSRDSSLKLPTLCRLLNKSGNPKLHKLAAALQRLDKAKRQITLFKRQDGIWNYIEGEQPYPVVFEWRRQPKEHCILSEMFMEHHESAMNNYGYAPCWIASLGEDSATLDCSPMSQFFAQAPEVLEALDAVLAIVKEFDHDYFSNQSAIKPKLHA
jgi:hypothetical protein